MKKSFVLFLLFTSMLYNQLSAVNIEVTNRKYLYTINPSIISSGSSGVVDPELGLIIGSTAQFYDKNEVGYLQLGIDPDLHFCYDTNYYRIEVTFGITYKKLSGWACGTSGPGTLTHMTDIQTLTIEFDPVNRQVYTEKARILYDAAYKIDVSVANVKIYDRQGNLIPALSSPNYSVMPKDLYWETGIQIERYRNFDYNIFPSNFNVSHNATTNEIVFNWAFQTGAEYYEIEYAYINDYSSTNLNTQLTTANINATFKNNSSRVRINNTTTTYRIPNIFDRGYVIARIRGVGVKGIGTDGCPLVNEIQGFWSFEQTPTTPFVLNSMPSTQYVAVNRHEGGTGQNKNWKASISFAEDGKHKEIVEYADGSSRVRQSVTKLSSTNEAIVGETVYDHQGRPTVQILPVPVTSSIVKYYSNFNLEDASSTKFSREHFDTDNLFGSGCIPPAPQLSTTSGASYYYSTANTFQNDQQAYVADANKYPYTQVVYTPDNTGRIKMQSGVGSTHILGSDHETKYFYGKPTQVELDRLFGTNVGYSGHYQKNMVVDANGQVSISFLDMAGKTIATSLAGTPVGTNLTPLEDPTNSSNNLYETAAETLTVNLLGDVTIPYPHGQDNHLNADGTVWSNTTPLLVETEQTYHFNYSADLKDYLDACLNETCFDCVYDLHINVLNSCNEPMTGFPFTIHLGGNDPDTICNEDNQVVVDGNPYFNFDLLLEVGNYTVVKTLTLDEDVIGYYTEKYIANNTCLLTRDDFFVMPDTSGCFYSCDDCLAALGTEADFITEMLALNSTPSSPSSLTEAELKLLYAQKKAGCDQICEEDGNDMCQAGYRMMLRDLTPGVGQYAAYALDVNGHAAPPVDERLSIFAIDHLLPDYANTASSTFEFQYNSPKSDTWRFPRFFDKNDATNVTGAPNYLSNLNKHYFEANGDTARVIVDLQYGGGYLPNVVPGAPVNINSLGQRYTYPQYLSEEDDFISRFNESWARSLLVYHPEFLFYKECLEVSSLEVTINGEDYNTWEFDNLLQNYDRDLQEFDGASFPLSWIMPTTSTNDFYFHEIDPFFSQPTVPASPASTPYISIFPLSTPGSEYGLDADRFVIFPLVPETLNIQEAAYVSAHYPVSNPGFLLPAFPLFSNNAGYVPNQGEWDMAVGSHIAIKQKVFWKYIQFRVYEELSLSINNLCVGNQTYDPGSPWHTTHPWLPCDLVEHFRYENKQVIFAPPSGIYNNGAFDPPPPTPEQLLAWGQQQIFEATGKCPAAIDLQTFLNSMLQDGVLDDANVDIENSNYVMLSLRDKLETFYGAPIQTYHASVSGQTLTALVGTNPFFTLTLPSGYSWTDVQALTNVDDVFLSGGDFTFTVQAQVTNLPTVDWIEVAGVTELQIGGCEDELLNICKATQEGKDFKYLLTQLKFTGDHVNTNVSLTTGTYISFITPALLQYLGGTTADDIRWNYTGGGVGKLINNTTGNFITMMLDAGSVTLFQTGTILMHSIAGDISVSPTITGVNDFIISGYSSTGLQLLGGTPDLSLTGTMSVTTTSTQPFPVSFCDAPLPADCQTIEHKNWFELKDYLLDQPVMTANPCITDVSPSGGPSSFELISLLPDLDFSTDGVSSTHFIAVLIPTGTTTPQTYYGTYCKPIRACLECDTLTTGEPCNEMFYVLDLTGYSMDPDQMAGGAFLDFTVSKDLGKCYPDLASAAFQPSTQIPGGPFTTENILDEWANYLNSISNGSYSATHPVGTQILVFQLNDLDDNDCECLPEQSDVSQLGNFVITFRGTTQYQEFVNKFCCDEYVPITGSGPVMPDSSGNDSLIWDIQPVLSLGNPCDMNLTPFDLPPPPTGNPCVEALLAIANMNADNAYNNYLDSVTAAFRAAYITQCMSATEEFQVTFINTQYHFTLYYYDQAGNLVKTVPPVAVKTIPFAQLGNVTSARNNPVPTSYLANHDVLNSSPEMLSTKYDYNTLNQPRHQQTPDGGTTQFIYDALGRLALSQNQKQLGVSKVSYTTYDKLGRITEVGELSSSSALSQNGALLNIDVINNFILLNNASHREITTTTYDVAYGGNPLVVQTELRNRVSFTTYRDAFADPYRSATYYSYDIHGNVKELWNENKDVPQTDHQIKKMQYFYDLVSGKVNKVTYQPGKQDQWIHKYSYDADNRLTKVETSRDDVFYDRDASYFYYKHGPLARTEYGHLNVQGTDYAYTIHGWLKDVNATNLDATKDMGHDANLGTSSGTSTIHKFFAKDVYSYALHYYNGDYNNISNNTSFIGNISAINTSNHDLFNGNISLMQTTILNSTNDVVPYLSRYKYDQLNRIVKADYDTIIALTTNVWTDNFTSGKHYNMFRYDANGNIKTQVRSSKAGTGMDDLTYKYVPNSNQLDHVEDLVNSANFSDDLDMQSPGNYGYDAIGNLTRDDAEQIASIDWTVYGKVKKVNRTSTSPKDELEFGYGPGGQRLTKKVIKDNGDVNSSYYFYDASGNMMGIYNHTSTASTDLYLEEQMMYGSSRLGSVQLHEKLVTPSSGVVVYKQKRGQKRYELNNHLGNVLSTISDRRKLVCSTIRYEADLINTFDYSPFGAPLHGRSLASLKCSNYTTHQSLYAINDNFNTVSLPIPITLVPTPLVFNYYINTANTTGSVVAQKIVMQKAGGGGGTRAVAKQFGVLSGKNYNVKFKMRRSGANGPSTFAFKIIDQATNTAVVSVTSLAVTTSFTQFSYTNLFTPSTSGTYRIELSWTASAAVNMELDDVQVWYEDDVVSQVCVPTGGNYRFGFNGMEKLNEQYGEGNAYDFGARLYDPRLGRWMACDPLSTKYPAQSPYQFAANSPLLFIDPDGEKIRIYYQNDKGKTVSIVINSKNLETAVKRSGNNKFVADFVDAIHYLQEGGADIVTITDPNSSQTWTGSITETLINSSKTIKVVEASSRGDNAYRNRRIVWDSRGALITSTNESGEVEGALSPALLLVHEKIHAIRDIIFGVTEKSHYVDKEMGNGEIRTVFDDNLRMKEEELVTKTEGDVAKEKSGETPRKKYTDSDGYYESKSPTSPEPKK